MKFMNYEILGLVVAALFFILGGVFTLYRMANSIRSEREEENAKILQSSREYTDTKVRHLESEIRHQRDLNEGKINDLSEKIEQLREEMRRQHTQLVSLLTKMIDRN